MELSSSTSGHTPPPHPADLQMHVARLTEALENEQAKLVRWKERAQLGVDELRRRIVDLTAALEAETAEKERLSHALSTRSGADTATPSLKACDCVHHAARYLDALEDSVASLLVRKTEHCMEASVGLATASTALARGELDVYKRRTETTLRLQSKSNEALQHQVQELQATLASHKETLQERERTLQVGNDTVSTLEQRLKEALDAKAALETQQHQIMSGPDMEELNQLEERYEMMLQSERRECSARENAIFAQHAQELQRQAAQHDAEMRALQTEWERRLHLAVEEASRQQKKQAHDASLGSPPANRDALLGNDTAYKQLLREHEVLKSEFQALQTQCRTLKATAQVAAAGQPSALATSTVELEETVLLPPNLPDAHEALQAQFATIQQLSQEAWGLKRELLDMKRRSSEEAQASSSSSPPPLSQQQFEYLKSVVVNVLCFHRDDRFVRNLLPVLSTLLHMTSADLRQVCSANPSWSTN